MDSALQRWKYPCTAPQPNACTLACTSTPPPPRLERRQLLPYRRPRVECVLDIQVVICGAPRALVTHLVECAGQGDQLEPGTGNQRQRQQPGEERALGAARTLRSTQQGTVRAVSQ
jgi:hypothetical protein